MDGIESFIKAAEANRLNVGSQKIWCPCMICKNFQQYDDVKDIEFHLMKDDFMPKYTCWSMHGESRVEHGTSSISLGNHDNDNLNVRSDNLNVPSDNLSEMLNDLETNVDDIDQEKLKKLIDDSEKPLYTGSEISKVDVVLKLFNLKSKHGWSDKSFTDLLVLLHDILPKGNELPISLYQAKKMTCPMGLEVQRIHACPNDCMLYVKDFKQDHKCFYCGVSRYKRKFETDEVNDDVTKNGPPAKLLWYLPIIPRLKRLFSDEKEAKLLRWHSDSRVKDGKLRHVADSPQWRNIDNMFPEFGNEIRNIRLGLSSDGFNPFGNMSSRHSPKQPGNNIDVYLSPLIDDLKTLWNTGVEVYDAYKKEYFKLRAMIFCTISDFPAYGNLSGYKTKEIGLRKKPFGKKKSIFWDLPYWKNLQVRHCLDVMHIEKNVCESLIGLLLNIPGKTKDGINVRKDMEEMGIRKKLAPVATPGGKFYLPPACYTMSKDEKTKFCKCLQDIKVPSSYSANIKKLVSMKDLKLLGMKSHDCHVLMTHMIPIAVRGLLPDYLRHTITKLCLFFNKIHSKVIEPESLNEWQKEIIITLCELEMYFPPSFFDVMVHLVIHIVGEIQTCGPVFLRYMYPFERYMGFLKGYVRNHNRPEGSIVEGYTSEEVAEFCTGYLDGVKSIGVPQSRHSGRLAGKGGVGMKTILPNHDDLQLAHFEVLKHMACIAPYITEHKGTLRSTYPGKSEMWYEKKHNKEFADWIETKVMRSSGQKNVDKTVERLGRGPDVRVTTYQGYDINGYTFYTKDQDEKSTMQNSGVTVIASRAEFDKNNHSTRIRIAKDSYYGVIQEIWELNYHAFEIPVFKCKWVNNHTGVIVDKYGFTQVDLATNSYASEPFILAEQVTQVFFVNDLSKRRYHIVLQGKRRILGVDDVVDEEEYNQFDDLPPFSVDVQPGNDANDQTSAYLRSDHTDGIYV
ncbi:uncharacterized protein LOC110888688 [Helianthus annuus]|uniref:uncharacterized protein LOC110888688 n=1 Tax=Helianthus annuus TaxID=4232 RepID=UPI000B8FCFBC|nr:uncharacterized protein LOC110888688 [Helianthus annuus]